MSKSVSFARKNKVMEYTTTTKSTFEYLIPINFGRNSRPRNRQEKIFNKLFQHAYVYIVHEANTWPQTFNNVLQILSNNDLSYEFFVNQCILIYHQLYHYKNFILSYKKCSTIPWIEEKHKICNTSKRWFNTHQKVLVAPLLRRFLIRNLKNTHFAAILIQKTIRRKIISKKLLKGDKYVSCTKV